MAFALPPQATQKPKFPLFLESKQAFTEDIFRDDTLAS